MDTGKRELHGPGYLPVSRPFNVLLGSRSDTGVLSRKKRGAQSRTNYITFPLACQEKNLALWSLFAVYRSGRPAFGLLPASCYNLPALSRTEGLVSSAACVFCDIVRGAAPASIVYADSRVLAFMDIQPVNKGHLLVVPRVHATYLNELKEETGGWLFQVGMKLAGAMRQSGLRCEGVNLFLADGEAAGQEVFHVHLHVIPRYQGDGFGFRFAPEYYRLPERVELDEVAAEIRGAAEE